MQIAVEATEAWLECPCRQHRAQAAIAAERAAQASDAEDQLVLVRAAKAAAAAARAAGLLAGTSENGAKAAQLAAGTLAAARDPSGFVSGDDRRQVREAIRASLLAAATADTS